MNLNPDQNRPGKDITDQEERGAAPGIVVSVRLDRDDARRLLRYGRETAHTVSEVARLAIRSFLDTEEAFSGLTSMTVVWGDQHLSYGAQTDARTLSGSEAWRFSLIPA